MSKNGKRGTLSLTCLLHFHETQLSLAIVYFHYDLQNFFDIPLSKTAKFSSKAVCFKSTFLVLNPLQLVVEDFHTLFIVALSCYRSGFENGIHGK